MRYIIFFIMFVWCLSCTTKPVISENCETVGSVIDYTGLDGCSLLIQLENGDLLNPVVIKGGFELKDQQVISFSYTKLEDAMSICMREKYQVEITCITELGKTPPGVDNCVDTDNPFAIKWMDHAIDLHNPNQVVKYEDGKGWAYLFRSIPNSYLYNCKGKLICETKNDHDRCQMEHLAPLGEGKIIWQGEGVWD